MKIEKSKHKKDVYTGINYGKASELFKHISVSKNIKNNILPSAIIRYLAKAADRGLIFITHPDNPKVIDYLINGSIPQNWETRRIIHSFQKSGYVSISEGKEGKITVKITKNGIKKALTYQLDTMKLNKLRKWDNKWRVIIFDVPVKYNRVRDIFRARLRQLGLYKLQGSVYISPYPCFDEIEFLRQLYGIPFTIRYLLAERIENDKLLRQYFELP